MTDVSTHLELCAAIRDGEARLADSLGEFLSLASPVESAPGRDGAVQTAVADRLWQCGFESTIRPVARGGDVSRHPLYRADRDLAGRPNVVGRKDGTVPDERSLMLVAHPDTLAPAEDGDERFCGAGGGKAALVAALHALWALGRTGIRLRGGVGLASIVDEAAVGLQGMLAFATTGVPADAALYLGSPCLELADAGPAGPAPTGVDLEAWACSAPELPAAVRAAAAACGLGVTESACPPACGAFLLANYANRPTAVLGLPREATPRQEPPAVGVASLLDYACLIGATLLEWCRIK